MLPEQTAQAAVDLKTELFMPIHWGAFKLAFHLGLTCRNKSTQV
jgi:hypothetical protein